MNFPNDSIDPSQLEDISTNNSPVHSRVNSMSSESSEGNISSISSDNMDIIESRKQNLIDMNEKIINNLGHMIIIFILIILNYLFLKENLDF